MRSILFTILISFLFTTNSEAISIAISPTIENPTEQETEKSLPWDIISISLGIIGLVLTFIPYLSIFGLLLCAIAILTGFIGRKKNIKKRLSNVGILLGSIGLIALITVIGLIRFF
jgi:hypothetical protein